MKQTYEQRVRALAERMARLRFKETIRVYEETIGGNEGLRRTKEAIESMLPVSRIVVAEMAYAYTLANLPHYHMDATMLASGMGRINREMIELGLIPDDGQGVNLVFDPKGSVHNPDNPEPPKESAFEGIVDRTNTEEIKVTLPCGYPARFFVSGLSDEEYIRRTQAMKNKKL